MTKREQKNMATKTQTEKPRFLPNLHLGSGVPVIITDVDGRAWRVDPESGYASPVVFASR